MNTRGPQNEDELRRQRARQRLAQRQGQSERGQQASQSGRMPRASQTGRSPRVSQASMSGKIPRASQNSRHRTSQQGHPVRLAQNGNSSRSNRVRKTSAAKKSSFNPRIILLLIAIVLLAVLAFKLFSCAGAAVGNFKEKHTVDNTQYLIDQSPVLIDSDAIQTALNSSDEVALEKLLTLASKEPLAFDFVNEFPQKYPQETGEPTTESVEEGTTPLLLQWDQRWGYTDYSGTCFALTGCGPTCMAMVYQGLTGNNDLTPYDMGQLAKENGFMTEFNGTDRSFFTKVAGQWGISANYIDLTESSLVNALATGSLVICNVGPGDFTTGGHYIVLVGLTDDGQLIVNDPFSSVRSEKTWDVSLVVDQAKAFIAFSI